MKYAKCLLFNFLIVFFVNYLIPGINVVNQTKLPHLGGDFPFALALGFLNSLIYPLLKLTGRTQCTLHIAALALAVNFISYALLKILPIGIQISLEGYFFGSLVVSVGSFVTNFLEMKAKLATSSLVPPSSFKQEPPKF